MDWEADSSPHIIQPAFSPWRKRSFDTYNDTNQPYYANEAYSGYRVTDALRNHTQPVAPFVDAQGRPAQYVTDRNGKTVLEAVIPPEPRKPIGHYLPEIIKWLIYGTVLLVGGTVELAGPAYIHTATVAVRVGNSAKRRLVEVTKKTFAPAPPSRSHRHDVPPHRRQSPIIRRVSPTSPGGRTHIPVSQPRVHPMATLKEAAMMTHECIIDYLPSSIEHQRSGAFVTSPEDGHLISGMTYQPYFEPLMSGALEDVEMDEDAQPDFTSSFSSYHMPGAFPDPPAPTGLSSAESPAAESPAAKSPATESQASDDLAIPPDQNTDVAVESDEQAVEDLASPRSEAYEDIDMPDVQPIIELPLQEVDSRPRNYKGELISDWQIRLCREIEAITHPPREMEERATNNPQRPQGLNAIGLIESLKSPLANGSPTTPHQSNGMTATGLIELRESPMAGVSPTGAANGTIDLHMTSMGLNVIHRSPLDLRKDTAEALGQPHGTSSLGLNDLHRSPMADISITKASDVLNDSHDAITENLHRPPGTAVITFIDSPQSPADVSPVDSQDETTATGLIDSSRSPVADASPINLPDETESIGLIDSSRSPLVIAPPIRLQPGTSPTGSIVSPRTPSGESPMDVAVEAAVDAPTRAHEASANNTDHTHGPTPVLSRSPPKSPSPTAITTPAELPSKWSIRSLYARVQGKPKKRSPLGERVNNANVHQVPKTPKKVTWPESGPVTGTKRFIKNEAMSHPSPASSREDSSILSSVPSDFSPPPSPTQQEQDEEDALSPSSQLRPFGWSLSLSSSNENDVFNAMSIVDHIDAVHKSGEGQTDRSSSSSENEASNASVETSTETAAEDPSTPPGQLSSTFGKLRLSSRRSSIHQRKQDEKDRKKAAEEKARKDREEAEEQARKDREEAAERARIKAEEEEERRKTGGRRIPTERVIQPLPPGWIEKVRINMAKGMREQLALTSVGNPLTRRDFGMVLPQVGSGDDPSGWLNDEIISGYLQAVVDHGHRAMGHPRGAKPRMHAFSPFFYTSLKERGYDAVKRWSNRAKIGGNDLKAVEYVFIPCNPSKSHWTLVVVSPVRKTIEVFDSMHGPSSDKVATTKLWLKGELGRSYVDSEWTVIEDPVHGGRGKGPTQNNVNDCGVFAVTTAKMLVLGVDPMAVSAGDMPLQRRRLVAELLNGGFSGEFEPRVVFK